jgi:hypothetical protein
MLERFMCFWYNHFRLIYYYYIQLVHYLVYDIQFILLNIRHNEMAPVKILVGICTIHKHVVNVVSRLETKHAVEALQQGA